MAPALSVRRVALVHEEDYFWHESRVDFGPWVEGDAQFETPEPRRRLLQLLQRTGLADRCVRVRASELTDDDLVRVHTPAYVARIRAADLTGGEAGESAPFGPGSFSIARRSAGGVHAAVASVLDGTTDCGFALVRPPGHHAEVDRGRGFCIFANIAVAIEKARVSAGAAPVRVAVVDWDVHHGNGSQSIYYDDADTLTVSIHQSGLYPKDSGRIEEVGGPAAPGTNINIPLPPGSGEGAYLYAWDTVIAPAVTAFKPDLIVVACGFDASQLDPSGRMLLTAGSFAALTARALDLAGSLCNGRLVLAQEGGYSPIYVPLCGAAVVSSLLGIESLDDPLSGIGGTEQQPLQEHQREIVDRAAQVHQLA
ncbi:MAG: class II histone deacetylase [Frankiales bacterium]|nr:class II histone deacetylase [Frankiales bacterium]